MKDSFKIRRCINIISISLLVLLGIPWFLEIFIFRNNVYSVISNEVWAGFLGSFIGGVIGGLGTLFAVYITTKETRRIQKDTSEQTIKIQNDTLDENRKLEYRKEKIVFTDEIANIVARYSTDISKYFFSVRLKANLTIERDMIRSRIFSTQHMADVKLSNGATNLMTAKNVSLHNDNNKLIDIERKLESIICDRVISIECYYLLKIKLRGISEAENILEQLEEIHSESTMAERKFPDWIGDKVEKLHEETIKFINVYLDGE